MKSSEFFGLSLDSYGRECATIIACGRFPVFLCPDEYLVGSDGRFHCLIFRGMNHRDTAWIQSRYMMIVERLSDALHTKCTERRYGRYEGESWEDISIQQKMMIMRQIWNGSVSHESAEKPENAGQNGWRSWED